MTGCLLGLLFVGFIVDEVSMASGSGLTTREKIRVGIVGDNEYFTENKSTSYTSEKAQDYCNAHKMKLVTLQSPEELQGLNKILNTNERYWTSGAAAYAWKNGTGNAVSHGFTISYDNRSCILIFWEILFVDQCKGVVGNSYFSLCMRRAKVKAKTNKG